MDDLNVYVSLTGFFFSLLILWSGVGAGVLVIPTLITLFHIDPLVAVASGSAFAFMSKILMTLGHAKYGGIDWRVAIRFLGICLPITVGTSATTAVMSQAHQGALFELTIVIAIILAGLLALTALLSTRIKTIISTWPMSSLSGVTGLLMGLTGVGGGVMVVPALATTGGLPIKIAVATSIPIGLILSLAVSITLGSSGLLDYPLILSLMLGAVIAIPLGTRMFHFFADRLIKQITCGLIGLALIDLIIQAIDLMTRI